MPAMKDQHCKTCGVFGPVLSNGSCPACEAEDNEPDGRDPNEESRQVRASVPFICSHCFEKFTGVEAAHHLAVHLIQKHKGLTREGPLSLLPAPTVQEEYYVDPTTGKSHRKITYRQISSPIPIEHKANPMHLRDVAMNQIGEWVGEDLKAIYFRDMHGDNAYFWVNGKKFRITMAEVD